MKKKKFLWMLVAILTSSLMTATFTACSSDDDDNNSTTTDPYADIEERVKNIQPTDSGTINAYEQAQQALQAAQSGNGSEVEIEYYKQLLADMEHEADSIDNANGGNGLFDALTGFCYKYKVIPVPTTAADGSEIMMSVLIAWPTRVAISDPDAHHLVLLCHFTITKDDQRPSNYENLGLSTDCVLVGREWAGSRNYLVVIPDYEGYGDTKNRVHPYLSREVQAKQCVDAVCWGQAWYNTNTKMHLEDGWKVISVGYSQGGAVSAPSYRYWLDHPEMHRVVPRWAGAVCGDGPYDPYATLRDYCSNDYLQMPCAPLLMLNGLCKTDQEMIAAGIQPRDFCTPAVANCGIFDMMDKKEKTTFELDMEIFKLDIPKWTLEEATELRKERVGKPHARGVLNDDTYNFMIDGTLPSDPVIARKLQVLEHCLKKNALWYKDDNTVWTAPAGSKFTFFHSVGDYVVPFRNVQSLMDKWGEENSFCDFQVNNTDTRDHESVGTAFFAYYYAGWMKDIINDKWNAGHHLKFGGLW